MVVNDADKTSARIDKGQLRDLIHQFLTEVCRHVGDFYYQIGGTGPGTLGLLFGAQDEATFAEFLLLAGLAMPIMNEIHFDKTHIQVLIDTCKIMIPDTKQQTRRKLTSGSSKKSQGIHYLYVGREVVGNQTSSSRRRQLQPKQDNIRRTTLEGRRQLQPQKDIIRKTTLEDQLDRDKAAPLQTEVNFQTARDAFMETNPLVKQALLEASKRAAQRTKEKEVRDEDAELPPLLPPDYVLPLPMELGSPTPVAAYIARHERYDNVHSPMVLGSPPPTHSPSRFPPHLQHPFRLFSPSTDTSSNQETKRRDLKPTPTSERTSAGSHCTTQPRCIFASQAPSKSPSVSPAVNPRSSARGGITVSPTEEAL